MTSNLKPQAPFIWPEPRIREGIAEYDSYPPFNDLVLGAASMFGVISAITTRGVDVLEEWLEQNRDLKAAIIVAVYPACATSNSDLARLRAIVKHFDGRIKLHVWPLLQVTDRSMGALCFSAKVSDTIHIVAGSGESFGVDPWKVGDLNFVFRADPPMVEAFKRHFDWLCTHSCDISSRDAAEIPELSLPEGSAEGGRMWQDYLNRLTSAPANEDVPTYVAHVDPETGDVIIKSPEGNSQAAPTEWLGIRKLDPLAERIARLYEQGSLVSVDKLSRIPPLDAPLDPSDFGDAAALVRGSVKRTVSMRASVIDEKTLKEIEKCRQGLRTLLTKFTFGLADNMRWMPNSVRELFDAELRRMNENGQALISDLVKGDVDAFMKMKHEGLVADLNGMHAQLGKPGQVTPDIIAKVVESLKDRLKKAQTADFMPKLSYSSIGFKYTDSAFASPWGQAYSFLSDVAVFPRKAHSDSFFFRGLKTSKKDLIGAMNIADDALLRETGAFVIEDRSNRELELLSRIEKVPIEANKRCELVWKIINGDPAPSIEEELEKASP